VAGWDVTPIEPPSSGWAFPDPTGAPEDLIAVGADLTAGTLLNAYRSGYFPMPHGRRQIGWWSPNPRGVMRPDGLRVTRSMRQSARRFEIRVDTAFRPVMEACGDPRRPHGWINPAFIEAYARLFELGWVHSIEVYDEAGVLAGGLYGVRIGGLFAGESMFHHRRDASKVALMALVELMQTSGMAVLDVQWATDHLRSLGIVEVARETYLAMLAEALR
jgi:leucyl/phenylalanyl-tRNA---protein transferase